MKMREWVRATYLALKERPAAERTHHYTQTQVEDVMQMCIQTLIEALASGEELRTRDLGYFWVETLRPRQIVSNLEDTPRVYDVDKRFMIRFRPSRRVLAAINEDLNHQ